MNDEFWEDMREEGFMVVDCPDRKVAIFANTSGHVLMATLMDDKTQALTLEPEEVADVIAKLAGAKREAAVTGRQRDSEFSAYLTIEKARSL